MPTGRLPQDWHRQPSAYLPGVTRIERWNVKTMEIKETANVPSSEGLISRLDISVLFKVPTENVVSVRKNIGIRYVDIVLIPNMRDAIRNVVSGYQVKALFSDTGRSEIADKLFISFQVLIVILNVNWDNRLNNWRKFIHYFIWFKSNQHVRF